MDIPVNNINDLRSEIIRLEKLKQQQEMDLKKRYNSPSSVFSAAFSLFNKSGDPKAASKFFTPDIIGLVSRFVLPITLNKTLFKGSNVLVKTLVGLVSQKASAFINDDAVHSIWDKAKGLLSKVKLGKKKKGEEEADEHHVKSAVL